jgi:hypothetical protein
MSSAKKRNLEFDIRFEFFKKFCVRFDYIGRKGRSAESYTIDRVRNDRGYTEDNIQVMKKRDNVIKYFNYDYRTKRAYTYELPQPQQEIENIF